MKTDRGPTSGHRFDPGILRKYDIRGVVGVTLFEESAYAVGRSLGTIIAARQAEPVCVGYDGRLTSPALAAKAAAGFADCGLDVLHIGLCPTPMLYFAVHALGAAGGIMVTGSHNPANHNGFKMLTGTGPFYGEQIQALGGIAAAASYASGAGNIRSIDIMDRYIDNLVQGFPATRRAPSVVWDAGNGAAGTAMQRLAERLPGRHILLNEKIDGTFPAHHPDPAVAENLVQLRETVVREECDIGIAFDGDGDRIGVVDSDGEILWGDQILILLAEDVLARYPGTTVIADVKSSQALFDRVAELGGIPEMRPSGHSLMKARMAESGALLAGELSGHIFIADGHYGYDDALYAAVRILSLLYADSRDLREFRAGLPVYFSTPEIQIPCAEERKAAVISKVASRIAATGEEHSTIDGVRVTTDDGWWLLRCSNTQSVLVSRCEAKTREGLARLIDCVADHLRANGIKFDAPPPCTTAGTSMDI